MPQKLPLVIIAGPTACGKTASSISLASQINGEIISADSMQVYKYMDIGTAKITKSEMNGVKHYLIDEFNPDDDFSVAVFKNKAKSYIDDIHSRGKIPILVGGTGFYINSIIYDNDFTESEKDTSYREYLQKLNSENILNNNNNFLHDMLKEIDFEASEEIHPNNIKKIIRALEFFHHTGEKISVHNKTEKQREQAYNTTFFVLNMDRALLYNRINLRVDLMIENGLLKEVENLLKLGYDKNLVSMQGLGYKEIVKYLEGEYTLEYAIEILKRDTRRFAKKQLTWFNHQAENAIWLDVLSFESTENLVAEMVSKINR